MIHIPEERLKQQLNFLYEIDKLKTIFRRTNLIADTKRLENTAEHSWHLAMYVMILAEYANTELNLMHVLKLVLLHDLVEIDAGDTFCYDEKANVGKHERELLAAKRIFGLLPKDQGEELMNLWLEFEAKESPEARFAASIDHLQPVLHNYITGGGSWTRHNISRQQVEKRVKPIAHGSTVLGDIVDAIVEEAVQNKWLRVET